MHTMPPHTPPTHDDPNRHDHLADAHGAAGRTDDGDRDRFGAVWVTAAGTLLLFAAATTFVAVRWDQLLPWHKFAILLVLTQALLVGGWTARNRVPATAAALFSLGAVLVPLDAWTIAASGTGDWQRGLFVGGLLAVLVLPIARRLIDTVALRWAWAVAVPLACAGTSAAVGPLPTAPVVAALGLVALSAGRTRRGLAWLGAAAVAPIAVLAAPGLPWGGGVLHDLGLDGPFAGWSAVAVATALLFAVATEVRRLERPDLAAVGVVAAIVDLGVALLAGDAGTTSWWLTTASLFLAVEIATTLTERDSFWGPRLARVAAPLRLGNLALSLPLVSAGAAAGAGPASWVPTRGVAGLTAVLLAATWMVADERSGRAARRPIRHLLTGEGSLPAGAAVATHLSVALLVLPVDGVVTRALFVALGAAFVLGRRSGGAVTGTTMVAVAALPPTAGAHHLVVSVTAAIVLVGAVRRERTLRAAVVESGVLGAVLFLSLGLLLEDLGWTSTATTGNGPVAAIVSVALAGLAFGSAAARRGRPAFTAVAPWLCSAVGLGLLFGGDTPAVVVLASTVVTVAWFVVEAVRRFDAVPAVFAATLAPLTTVALLRADGVTTPGIALGLSAAATVLVGLQFVLPPRPRPFLLGSAGLHLVAGLCFAKDAPGTAGLVVLTAGLLMGAVAAVQRLVALAYNGAVLVVLGSWAALSGYRVDATEAYLAPLSVVLALAGIHARRQRGLTSWVADVPAILVLGGGALAMRWTGDPGWHAVVAGAVGVAAVAAGAWFRLAGPLFVGSSLLAVVTLGETVAVTAGVPTWTWLALGGVVLVGAGITMELRGLGPVESGKRLAQMVSERFE